MQPIVPQPLVVPATRAAIFRMVTLKRADASA